MEVRRRRELRTWERDLLRNCQGGESMCSFRLMLRLPCVSVNCQNNTGNTPLHHAVEARCLPKVRRLIDQGADLHLPNDAGATPFRQALTDRLFDIFHCMCFSRQVHLDSYSLGRRETALHQACVEENLFAVQILLYAGANPDLPFRARPSTCRLLSCLDLAVLSGNVHIVHQLLLFNCKPVMYSLLNQDQPRAALGDQAQSVGKVLEVLQESYKMAVMLVEAGCPLPKLWRSGWFPALPADSPLKELLQELPSLRRICRMTIRGSLNGKQDWRKDHCVREQVSEVLAYYTRWDLPMLYSKRGKVQDYLNLVGLGAKPEKVPEANMSPGT